MEVKLEQFSGPLDMLLTLIEKQKLEINHVSISAVTEQYLELVEGLGDVKAHDLADFLVVAAKLLLHKSRAILPQFLPDEEDGPTLEEQLRLYRAFIEASKNVQSRWQSGKIGAFRIHKAKEPKKFHPSANLQLENMHASMVQLVGQLKPAKALPSTTIDRTISIKQTIKRIKDLLKRRKKVNFSEAVGGAENKTEIIVGFLALLELVKKRQVGLEQDKQFSDILITRKD